MNRASTKSLMCLNWRTIVFHTLVILDLFAAATAAGIWVSRPWWENVSAPSVAAAYTWAPMRLGATGWMCWRPLQWVLRHQEGASADTQIWQWDAGPGGRLVLVVKRSGQAGKRLAAEVRFFDSFLQVMSQRLGFVASPVTAGATATLQGHFVTFSYWQLGGLRPIAWCGWAFRARDGDLIWTACATAPKESWDTFSADAWAVTASLRPLARAENPGGAQVSDE